MPAPWTSGPYLLVGVSSMAKVSRPTGSMRWLTIRRAMAAGSAALRPRLSRK
jgi:hypothetical protein